MRPSLQKNDVLFAHIALNLAPGLSSSARRVAGAIIEHFNKKTGQCDPSVGRLAVMLGIDRATVLRATAELCEGDDRLFDKDSHGGHSHRASYLPIWERFNAIVDDWDLRMKDGEAPSKVAKLRRSRSQDCDVEGRKTATQTYRRNLQKEPPQAEPLGESPANPALPKGRKGLRNEGASPPRQRYLIHAVAGGIATSHGQAARAAAERRLDRAIRTQAPTIADALMISTSAECWEQAADAELARPGAGLAHLLAAALAGGADIPAGVPAPFGSFPLSPTAGPADPEVSLAEGILNAQMKRRKGARYAAIA